MFPRIHGIVCTDEDGRLYFDHNNKKRLIARHPNVPSWVSPMDFSVLKRFLETHWKTGTLVITGANTYKAAEKLLTKHSSTKQSQIMITHPDHFCLATPYGPGNASPYPSHDPLEGLRLAARQLCLDNNLRQILVMGGRSVYNAFAGYYDHFTHCRVLTQETSPPEDGGAIFPDIILGCPKVLDHKTRGDHQLGYNVTTPIMEDGYVVTQFNREREQIITWVESQYFNRPSTG